MSAGDRRGDAGSATPEPVSIVRYPNRRLYDRSQGRYVTLPEIAATVREGKEVQVRDSRTNDDLTSVILTQIILENHPERMALLPVPVLHQMIRTNQVVLGLLHEYFHQSLAYLDFWERASAFNPMAASVEWMKSLAPARGGETDADALARRLEEMERRLNALDPSAGRGESENADQEASPARPDTPGRSGRERRPRRGK